MWLDKSLIILGKNLRLKIGKDTLFGVYNHQYFSIKKTQQQGQQIIFRLKPEAVDIVKSIFDTKKSKELTGSRFHSYQVTEESLVIMNVQPAVTAKRNQKNLITVLDLVSNKLLGYQKFSEAKTEETVLIEELPGPRSEDKIRDVQRKLEVSANKKLDHERALLLGTPVVAIVGIVLGYLSSLIAIHFNSDLNPFGKGILSVVSSTAIYAKITGGVNSASRYFILLMSVIGFICWDLARIFFQVLQKTGKEFELKNLLEVYERELFNLSTLGKFALIAIGTIIIFSFFFLKRTDRKEVQIEEGELLEGKALEEIEETRRGQVIILLLFVIGALLSLPLVLISFSVMEEFSYLSYLPFFLAGLVTLPLMMGGFFILSKKCKRLELGLAGWNKGAGKRASILGQLLFISVTPAVGIVFFLSYINLAYDESLPTGISTVLMEHFPSDRNECKNVQLNIKDSKESFSYRICKRDFSYLEEGTEIRFDLKQGALWQAFVFNLHVPPRESLKGFLTSGKTLKDLRYAFLVDLFRYDKSESFQKEISSWEKYCRREPNYTCRLASYVSGINSDHKKEVSLLEKGCFEGTDPIACRGIMRNKTSSEALKKRTIKNLEVKCDQGSDEHCMEWGWTFSSNPTFDKKRLMQIFEKPCKRGNKEACLTLQSLTKN